MHFSARGVYFFLCKLWGKLRPFFARPFFKAQIFFHDFFFILVCFQDEVKELSSWKFLIGIGLVIGFGNDVSRLKKQLGCLRVKF